MDHSHEHSPNCHHGTSIDVFVVVKSGILIAVQEYVAALGDGILNTFDDQGCTPAHWAGLKGHKLILEFIIQSGGWFNEPARNDQGQRPIHWAAREGHCAIVELLLQHGVSVDIQDSRGKTPLIVASQSGKCALAALLIARGSSKAYLDCEGDGPLHWAAYNGNAEMARMLVYFGFDPEQSDLHLQRPIHLASLQGKLEVVRDLCNVDNVDINVTDKNGASPLSLATKKTHFAVTTFLKEVARRDKKYFLPRSFRSCLDGSFMTGSTNRLFIFLTCFVLLYGYPAYVYECLFTTWNDLLLLHMCFLLLNVVFWVSFMKTHARDPGFLPQNNQEYFNTMKNLRRAVHRVAFSCRQIASYHEIRDATEALGQLCHSCRIVKPLRTKHCRICGRCVEVFDHHCFYVGNCIGLKNRVWFFIFVFTCIGLSFVSLMFCYHLYSIDQEDYIVAVGCTMLVAMLALALTIFTCILGNIRSGMTNNERINWQRYKYLQDAHGRLKNPYNRGVVYNMVEYFNLVKKGQAAIEFNDLIIV